MRETLRHSLRLLCVTLFAAQATGCVVTENPLGEAARALAPEPEPLEDSPQQRASREDERMLGQYARRVAGAVELPWKASDGVRKLPSDVTRLEDFSLGMHGVRVLLPPSVNPGGKGKEPVFTTPHVVKLRETYALKIVAPMRGSRETTTVFRWNAEDNLWSGYGSLIFIVRPSDDRPANFTVQVMQGGRLFDGVSSATVLTKPYWSRVEIPLIAFADENNARLDLTKPVEAIGISIDNRTDFGATAYYDKVVYIAELALRRRSAASGPVDGREVVSEAGRETGRETMKDAPASAAGQAVKP